METKITRRDLQQAICETAWSLYYKAERIQYDSNTFTEYDDKFHGGNFRTTLLVAPEYATRHTGMYQVCSAFAYTVYHNALEQDGAPYRLNGGTENYASRHYYDRFPEAAALVRWTRNEETLLRFDNREIFRNQENFAKFYGMTNDDISAWLRDNWEQLLQPGDLMITFTATGAHTVMYVGHGLMLESTGLNYKEGKERREATGTIKLEDVRDYFRFDEIEAKTSRLNDGEPEPKIQSFGVFRPLNLMVDENDVAIAGLKPSRAAATRFANRGLDIDKIVNIYPYGAAVEGETLTYTVTVKNHSGCTEQRVRDKDVDRVFHPTSYSKWCADEYGEAAGWPIRDLAIVEQIPAGTELVAGSETAGAVYDAAARTLRWTADVAAGESRDFTYTVKVTAPRGSDIVAEGTVAGLPSARIVNRVGGKKLPAGKLNEFLAAPQQFETALQAEDTAFAAAFYKEVFGVEVNFAKGEEIFHHLFETATAERTDIPAVVEKKLYLLRQAPAAGGEQWLPMLVRNYIGGTKVHTKQEDLCRVREFNPWDLEVGDVFVRGVFGEAAQAYVFLGGGKYARLEDGKLIVEDDLAPVWTSLLDQYFFALRPTQVL